MTTDYRSESLRLLASTNPAYHVMDSHARAAERIAEFLTGREWEAADLDTVAGILSDAGLEIAGPEDEFEPPTGGESHPDL